MTKKNGDVEKVKKSTKKKDSLKQASEPTENFVTELKDLAWQSLEDDKGKDIILIPMPSDVAIADYMIIASGGSNRQVSAMASHLVQKLKEKGIKNVRIEGAQKADWILIDAGDIIIHIFRPEVRAFYDIERIWQQSDDNGSASQIMHFSA